MNFIVSYLFSDNKEEGLQIDIVSFKDKKSCIEAYSDEEYESVEINEYDEVAILKEMYYESDENNLYDYEDEDYEDGDIVEKGLTMLFPNAETEEELEEELEHSYTRMMDN